MRKVFFRKLRVLEKFLVYVWTKMGSNIVWHFPTVFFFLIILISWSAIARWDKAGLKWTLDNLEHFCQWKSNYSFWRACNLYVLKEKTFDICSFSGKNKEAVLWNHRLGHNHFKNVKRLAHHALGMNLKNCAFDKLCCCEVCKTSMSRRQPVTQKMEKRKTSTSKLDLISTEILGPMSTTSRRGNRYAISFTDSFSRYSAVYFLKSKEECLDKFKVFCAKVGTPREVW